MPRWVDGACSCGKGELRGFSILLFLSVILIHLVRCEAGVRTGGRKLEGSKRETDRNGGAYPALLVAGGI